MLQTVEPPGINALQTEDPREVVDLAVDSGATDTMVGIE